MLNKETNRLLFSGLRLGLKHLAAYTEVQLLRCGHSLHE
jgi:hypothetical protein